MVDAGYILGIDAGTSVVKAAVFDEAGNELGRGARNVPIVNPQPHLAEEDMTQVWIAAAEAISHALTSSAVRAEEILAVSATGQGDGSWIIDAHGRPVGPAMLWTDGRAGQIIDRWYADGSVSAQFEISGSGPYAGTTSALIRWRLENQPGDFDDGASVLWCKDWIEYKLTGDVSSDPSDASLAGIDTRAREWSHEVLDIWGISKAAASLPRLRKPTDVCGVVTEEAAGLTGLKAGTPVFKGQMDITASSLGVGVALPGDCMAVIGTAGIVTVATDDVTGPFAPRDVGWVIPHTDETWIRALGMNCCTPNVDWFLREFGSDFRAEASASPGAGLFEHLDRRLLATPLGSGGVIYHGYLAPGGERAPFVKPSARGSFNGLTGSHTREHLLRAVYEGVAYGIRDCLDAIPTPVDTVRMAGGGANSAVWCQIFADVLGRRIAVPAGTEFGAKGAAIVAGVGLGLYSDYADGVSRAVNVLREYEPDPRRTALYDGFFSVYRSLRHGSEQTWDELQALTREAAAL